jgi:hypothetical protein
LTLKCFISLAALTSMGSIGFIFSSRSMSLQRIP